MTSPDDNDLASAQGFLNAFLLALGLWLTIIGLLVWCVS